MATTELGTGKVLHPDGLGGLFWGNTNTASVSTGIGGGGTTRYMETGPHDNGVYLILAFGRHRADRGNNDADRIHRTWQGFCLRSTNTLFLPNLRPMWKRCVTVIMAAKSIQMDPQRVLFQYRAAIPDSP